MWKLLFPQRNTRKQWDLCLFSKTTGGQFKSFPGRLNSFPSLDGMCMSCSKTNSNKTKKKRQIIERFLHLPLSSFSSWFRKQKKKKKDGWVSYSFSQAKAFVSASFHSGKNKLASPSPSFFSLLAFRSEKANEPWIGANFAKGNVSGGHSGRKIRSAQQRKSIFFLLLLPLIIITITINNYTQGKKKKN